MKIAIISDIHANLEALEAVLAKIDDEGADQVICLGDVVGYGANPNECVTLVRKNCLVTLLGNHDAATTGAMDLYFYRENARQAIVKTRAMLSQENYEWLYTLPYTYQMKGADFFHGAPITPSSFFYIVKAEEAQAHTRVFSKLAPLSFIGHSHMPHVFQVTKRHGKIVDENILEPSAKVKYIVNVGSVGQPRDKDPRAAFALWDTDTNEVQNIRVEYNIEAAARRIITVGFDEGFAKRLFSGS